MRSTRDGERGYLLLAVLFLMALLLFALATAAPRVLSDLRRDREAETVHRGMQYARAIQLYYRKFGHYPASIDELLESNHLRFLRRKYADPMTGKDTWRLIHVGESKTMTLGGRPGAIGIPAGQAGLGGTTPIGGLQGGATAIGGLQGGGAGLADGGSGLQAGQTQGGIVFGNQTPSQQSPDPNAPAPSSEQPGSATPGSNVGGGPIVGVSSTNPAASIKILKKMQKYNQWEFIYDPALDAGGMGGANGLQGLPTGGQANPLGGTTPAPDQPNPAPTPVPPPQP